VAPALIVADPPPSPFDVRSLRELGDVLADREVIDLIHNLVSGLHCGAR
jgi:hypothetical protein